MPPLPSAPTFLGFRAHPDSDPRRVSRPPKSRHGDDRHHRHSAMIIGRDDRAAPSSTLLWSSLDRPPTRARPNAANLLYFLEGKKETCSSLWPSLLSTLFPSPRFFSNGTRREVHRNCVCVRFVRDEVRERSISIEGERERERRRGREGEKEWRWGRGGRKKRRRGGRRGWFWWNRGFSRDIGRIIRRLSDGMSNEAECTAAWEGSGTCAFWSSIDRRGPTRPADPDGCSGSRPPSQTLGKVLLFLSHVSFLSFNTRS